MKFSDIPGLSETKKMLAGSVSNGHAAHAQLFAGAEGALNLPLALAYATYLHCEQKGEDACGECAACRKSLKFIHPDTHFVFPLSNVKGDKDDERFKADILKQWREFLLTQPYGNLDNWTEFYGGENKQALISREESREIIKTLSLKPFESQVKVMIIWQPEKMHPTAANGILKILEEPAPHTYFILVSNAADQLLPTIISRTQIVTVPLLSDEEIETQLVALNVNEKKASVVSHQAEGNLNLALALCEDDEEDDQAQRFAEWMRACFKKNVAQLVSIADDFHGLDKLHQRGMLQYSLNMMREVLLQLGGATTIQRSQGEELKFVQDFSRVMNLARVEYATRLINEAGYHLERNGSAKMIFMDLSLKISKSLNS
ncbi:MAG: DNA polymerase III subunit delta [Cyclobacteriaceae bacterium]|nr:DNA polymerase III subunit delta [Cyclobacteriaceae bacterium]